ncbi:MAG: hypothetical protein ACLQB1_29135 [Streptosporangiaceae bacterium]
MAGLLLKIDPRALDRVFGKDIASELDGELGLPPGTSGQVVRALASRLGFGNVDRKLQSIADRAAYAFPVTQLPDYRGWHGPSIPGARTISASLVLAGLATPDGRTAAEYVEDVRRLWVPDVEWVNRHLAT